MNFSKILLSLFLGIFIISTASALSSVSGNFQDSTHSATITDGDSISFNANFGTIDRPMSVSAKLFDSNNNVIYVFVDKSVNDYSFSNTYSITKTAYVNPGTYSIFLTATDKKGYSTGTTLTLTVNPISSLNNAPILTITGVNPVTLEVKTPYTDPGATATDTEDGNLTPNIIVTNNVNSNILGTYTLTYSVTDSGGKTTTATRTVNVVDTIAPVITILGRNPLTITKGNSYTEFGATVTDNYDIVLTVITSGRVNTNVIGTYTVTYNSTDSSGNTGTATRTINVISGSSGGGGSGGVREISTSKPAQPSRQTSGAGITAPTTKNTTTGINVTTLFYIIIGIVSLGIILVTVALIRLSM